MCYSKRLTRRATHIKRQREKQWLKAQAKDQLKWADEIRRKHKVGPVQVD
jgi:S-adenosylmethionine synthetase